MQYNFWRRVAGHEMQRITGSADKKNVELFQELVGICSLFSTKVITSENPFGTSVDVIPIEKEWSAIDVRDENGLWLAQTYLDRLEAEKRKSA